MTTFYAFKQTTGDGSTTDYTVPFDYLEESHILVKVNGVEVASTSYTFPSKYTLRFNDAPLQDAVITLKRDTPKDSREVIYQDGSTLNAKQLNILSKQLLFIYQELWDDLRGALHGENPAGLEGYVPDDSTQNDIVAEIASKLTDTSLYNDFETQKEDVETTAEVMIENALRTNDGIEGRRAQVTRIEKVEAETDIDGDGVPDAKTTVTENQTAIAGIEGKYAVKVDVNGRVTGYGLIQKDNDTGELEGTFDILSDNFTITDPDTLAVMVGWDGSQFIIDGNFIVDGSITASQMNVTTLSAISANLGTVNAGLFKTASSGDRVELEADATLPFWYGSGSKTKSNAKFYLDGSGNAFFGGSVSIGEGASGGAGLDISDSLIQVRDGNGAVRVKLGKLS